VICQANHAVKRGFGDRSFAFFVVIGTVRLAALNCRIFVLKWAKQIGQQLESIEA
jgi:hypothetical protein